MGRGYAAYRPHGTQDWLLIYTVSGKGQFVFPVAGGKTDRIITNTAGDFVAVLRRDHDYGVEETLCHWQLLWMSNPRPHWA